MQTKLGEVMIRTAEPEDAKELLAIYGPYVIKTAITFEYEVPSIEEFRRRIVNTLKRYPFLVAQSGGEILGYAYTGPFVGRAAYDWSAEVSIYLKEDKRKMGIGKKLYQVLEEISRAQNITNLNACIGCTKQEDEHLSNNSVQFHNHMGYEMVGIFHKCGYKFGRWYNMVWMEKHIGEHGAAPAPVAGAGRAGPVRIVAGQLAAVAGEPFGQLPLYGAGVESAARAPGCGGPDGALCMPVVLAPAAHAPAVLALSLVRTALPLLHPRPGGYPEKPGVPAPTGRPARFPLQAPAVSPGRAQ